MRQVAWSYLVVALAFGSVSSGEITDEPAETIFRGQFRSILVVDKTVLAIGPRGVVSYDWSVQTSIPTETDYLRFDMNPGRSKMFGDQFWVSDTGNQIQVFSLGTNLEIAHLYTVHIPHDFADFTKYGNDIIVSRWFDGLWRYRIVAGAEPQLVDTSYKGIHVTTVNTEGDNLYALDTYNGVMRYDLQGDTFGSFEEYLYTEFQGTTFSKNREQFFLTASSGGIIEGAFGNSGSGVNKVLIGTGIAKRVTATRGRLIYQKEQNIGWIDSDSFSYYGREWPVDSGLFDGAVFYADDGDTWFLYPKLNGGITRFSVKFDLPPKELLDRAGPITGLAFAHGMLLTGGRHSPIDVFKLDSTGRWTLNFSVTESHPATGPIVTTGDTILAIYPEDKTLARLEVNFATRKFIVAASIRVDTADLLDLSYVRHVRGNRDMAILRYPDRLDVYEWVDSSRFVNAVSWKPSTGGIQAYEVFDSVVVFGAFGNHLEICVINSDLTIGRLLCDIPLSSRIITDIEYSAPYLRVFRAGNLDRNIEVYNLIFPNAPVLVGSVQSPRAVADVQRFDKFLFTVGSNGHQIFDASDSIPVLIDLGGWAGTQLAVDSNYLAITDGHAIDFYLLSLFDPGIPPDDTGSPPPPPPPNLPTTFAIFQNYPNPFNGTTYIEYDIPKTSQVSIELYNVLGQKMRTLVSSIKEPGRYRAMWDGRNDDGADVATGIYYYRFAAGESRIVKKMLYLK